MARVLRIALLSMAALLATHVGAWAAERLISLGKVDQLMLGLVWIGTGRDEPCEVRQYEIETSIKFVLNTARIPFHGTEEVVKFMEREDQRTSQPLPEGLEERERELSRRIEESDRFWNMPKLMVTGDVLSTKSGCITHVEIIVAEEVEPTTLKYSGKQFGGRMWSDDRVPLWRAGFFGIAPPADLTRRISEGVEGALREFVNDRAADMRKAAEWPLLTFEERFKRVMEER